MCRSCSEGKRRCPADTSEARQARRVAQAVRARVGSHISPEPVTPDAPAILTLDELRTRSQQLQQRLQTLEDNDHEGYARIEQEVTALGASIAARVDAELNLDFTELESLQAELAEVDKHINKTNDTFKEAVRVQTLNLMDIRNNRNDSAEKKAEREELKQALAAKVGEISVELISAKERRNDIIHKIRDFSMEQRAQLADKYREVLGELRPMGGALTNLSEKSAPKAVRMLNAAMRNFPSDWIADSNAAEGLMRVKHTKSRAHYIHRAAQPEAKMMQQVSCSVAPAGWTPPADDPTYEGWVRGSELTEDSLVSYAGVQALKSHVLTGTIERAQALGREVWIVPDYEMRTYYPGIDTPPKGRGWEKATVLRGARWNADTGGYVGGEKRQVWRRKRSTKVTLTVSVEAELSANEEAHMIGEPGEGTATHEFAHRVEFTRKGITALENAFLTRRTTLPNGEREAKVAYQGRISELCYGDAFTHVYMGRTYPRSEAKEILSCGVEGLFGGSFGGLMGLHHQYKADLDMRNFILGTLASA